MALTATATKMLQRKVARILGMHRPIIFSALPCKRNIMFAMATNYNSIEVTFHLFSNGTNYDATNHIVGDMKTVLIYICSLEKTVSE